MEKSRKRPALIPALAAVLLLLATLACGPGRPEIDNVYLILIDGVRPDSLREARTPNLDALIEGGSYTGEAWTVWPSNTIAAVPALHTGAPPEVHKVRDWEDPIRAQTLSEVFGDLGKTTAVVRQSGVISNNSADHTTGIYHHPDGDRYFTDLAIELVEERSPFFLSLYYPRPDSQGHRYGHRSRQYLEAIEEADDHLGRFFDVLKEKGLFDRALIVVTTDHGMTGRRHGLGRETDFRIFSIWHGPGVREGYLIPETVEIPAAGPVRVEVSEILAGDWSAASVSWDSPPETGEVLDYRDVETTGWHSWDLTGYLEGGPSGSISLAKSAGATGSPAARDAVFFSTREWGRNPPRLELEYSLPGREPRVYAVEPELEVFVTEEEPEESYGERPNYYVGRFRHQAGRAFLRFELPEPPPEGRLERAELFAHCWRLYPAGPEENRLIAHRIIDIAPTITHLVGTAPPRESQGRVIFELSEQ